MEEEYVIGYSLTLPVKPNTIINGPKTLLSQNMSPVEIFNLLLGEELKLHLLNAINFRKNKRIETRINNLNPNLRGNIGKESIRGISNTYNNEYKKRFKQNWNWDDIQKFFAVILCMGLINYN